MKKLILIALLFICTNAFATPPSRIYTYTSGTTIRSNDVTSNEDALFNYLRLGVDTYADNTIVNADIYSAAAILSSKLDLSSISQDIAFSGNFTFAGSTIADLGIVTTADINGGTIDNTAINIGTSTFKFGTANQGDILYDNGTSFVRLTPSTSGFVLTTKGTSANPVWQVPPANIAIYTSGSGNWTAPTGITKVYVSMTGGGAGGGGGGIGTIGGGGGGGGASYINFPLTVVPGNNYAYSVGAKGTGGANGANGTDGGDSSFSTLTTLGGDKGGGNGSSGAGGVALSLAGGNASGATPGTAGGVPYSGGAGGTGSNSSTYSGGGGGGSYLGNGGVGGGTTAGTATGYGAGGGGARDGYSPGGDGSDGVIILMY